MCIGRPRCNADLLHVQYETDSHIPLLQARDSTPAKPLYSLDELKNKTAPDEKSSVSVELARKAIVKLKVKEESESHDGKGQREVWYMNM